MDSRGSHGEPKSRRIASRVQNGPDQRSLAPDSHESDQVRFRFSFNTACAALQALSFGAIGVGLRAKLASKVLRPQH